MAQPDEVDIFLNQAGAIRVTWLMWRRLWASEEADVVAYLLADTSPEFFNCSKWHIASGVVLAIARLGDKDDGKSITLQRVLSLLNLTPAEDGIRRSFKLAEANIDAPGMRRLRNKVIAHNDKAGWADVGVIAEKPTVEAITLAVDSVVQFAHLVTEYRRSGVCPRPDEPNYRHSGDNDKRWHSDIDRLVFVLEHGREALDE